PLQTAKVSSMDNIGQLLIGLTKAHRKTISDRLAVLDLYPGQDGLLYHLSKNDGLTMTELVEKLKIKHPTLFTMVTRMETAGLINKDKDKVDKRTSRIFLTNKGKTQIAALSQVWQDMEKQLLKGFSEAEISTAKSVLIKLTNNLTSA
ncbi:MAG: MarR family transcriptional regulator, partial [Phaeodactylibacter sp.]|nr:MarR family transcriptional regulator [Phaeodactylibacter sp.]